MSATPAAELARLKRLYPGWHIGWQTGAPAGACKAGERGGPGLLAASSPRLLAGLLADAEQRRRAQDGRNSKGVGGNGQT